jgi:hypothetical protein
VGPGGARPGHPERRCPLPDPALRRPSRSGRGRCQRRRPCVMRLTRDSSPGAAHFARPTLFWHRTILSCESTEAERCSRVAGERSVLSRLTFVRGQCVPRGRKVPDALPLAPCQRHITYCYSPSVEESTAKQPGCLPSKEVFRGDHVLLRRERGCATHAHGPRPGCDSWRPVSPGDA